ncbi:reverse transcriptase domain-containing protein [Tanacetum coccineum]
MVTPVEKRDPSKYCEFHSDTGHNTNECMQLRKQIDEMIKAGKLSQFIKELKQNDKPKAPKKGEASGKDKPLTILMIQPWERVAKPRITQSFSPETAMSFPPLSEEDGTESPMIVEVEMGGHFVHRVYIDGGASSEVLSPSQPKAIIGKAGHKEKSALSQQRAHGMLNSVECAHEKGRKELCSLLKQNLDIFAWKPTDMTGVPRNIAEHRLNIREGYSPVRQKKRGQASGKETSNPRRGGGGEGRSGPGISEGDFKDLNNACPKDCYPLPEIDWKVESLCGYSFKCFLDAYKGYHQIKMAKEDEEKTAFIKKQGYFSYPSMPFGLKNTGSTYQRLVDKAFQKQIGRNLECTKSAVVDFQCDETGSRRGLQADEKTYCGTSSTNRTKGKRGINHILGCSKRSYQRGLDDGQRRQANTSIFCKPPQPNEAGSQQYPNGKLVLPFSVQSNDFIVERPEEESSDELMAEPEVLPEPWMLFTDGSSCVDGSGAGLILTNPEGAKFTYAMRFRFDATNNEAEYEALIAGLRIAEKMGMVQYLNKVKTLEKSFKEFSIKQIPRSENKKVDALSKIASTSFAHLSKQVLVEELKEKSIDEKEILDIVEEEDNTWMTPICEYLTKEILPEDKKKARAVWRKAARNFAIRACIASVKHPQVNGLVERANRSLGEGIKARLDEKSKDWIEELPHVLWAHRTMIKTSNGETPFSLTYGTEAVIPAEIGMPTLRTTEIDQAKNNEALGINLDLIEERREQAAIQEAKSKKKDVNINTTSRVPRKQVSKPCDMVYRSNEASHARDECKLGPKWEGPYEVKESLRKGAYKLKNRKGNEMPRTWDICNLKKCYIHEV